jgi:hypothetical protein
MRITRMHIVNFRCLRELKLAFEDVTVLVGANGAGKSTVLHALAWFFDGGSLTTEDVSGHQPGEQVSVGVTFADFDEDDREALGSYVLSDEATFWRTWSDAGGEKLTGKGRAFAPFEKVRSQEGANPTRAAYNELREAQPDLGLPKIRSVQEVHDAMMDWESRHPDDLTEARRDATHLFGFAGRARLARRLDFVLVPAILDPEAQTQDARGTLLRQLLDRALGEQSAMRARLAELETQVSDDLERIMVDEGGEALSNLAAGVTEQLARLVSGGEVLLAARPPAVKVPNLAVDLRIADDGLETAVGRQGHGFQRALVIAVVQQLAIQQASDAGPVEDGEARSGDQPSTPSAPALFLALEEPELYQHPLQARHFAATLSALGDQAGATVQVAYATHSEHFVDPGSYHRLRRFRRRPGSEWPESGVTRATVDRVVERLDGVYDADQIALRVRLTLRRQVAEAVFAKAAILTEGDSDVGFLQGLADRHEGLDALGIAVVNGHGKPQLLIPWAILSELGVPAYVVFDGDAGKGDRMRLGGKSASDVTAAEAQTQRENELILKTLGADPVPKPDTVVTENFAVFADRLETEATAWPGFDEAVTKAAEEYGDWRAKSDDAYRHAASTVEADPPQVFADLLDRVRDLVF